LMILAFRQFSYRCAGVFPIVEQELDARQWA
jgi:hypothetical protein